TDIYTLFPTRRSSDLRGARPFEPLPDGDTRMGLAGQDPAQRSRSAEAAGDCHEPGLLVKLAGANRRVGVREVGRRAHHRHLESRSEEHTSELQSPCNL